MTMFQSGRNVKNLDSFKGLEERIDNIQGIEVEEVKTEEVKVEETPLKDVDLVFLLDKSGSMYSAVSDTSFDDNCTRILDNYINKGVKKLS